MKKNILVFPCGSEIGLEIYRSLCYSTHFNLIGGSSVEDHGAFVYGNYLGGIVDVEDPNFVEQINMIAEENRVDFIIPAHDSVLLKLARAKDSGQLKCGLITSPLETCEITRSKLKTYSLFKETLPTPLIYQRDNVSNGDLPVFLKPEVGQGSKGTYVAKSKEDVNFYLSKDDSLMLLEYLPGKEYTIDCFTDKDRKLLFCEGRERNRTLNGISVNTFVIKDPRFKDLADKINQKVNLRGAWFFQVKERDGGELVLMEIAPRIAGTMALTRCRGVNLVLLSLFDALGYDVTVFENSYEMVIDRALENSYKHNFNYSHVYIDLDDLVIAQGAVNPAVMAFLYQCVNKKLTVHLITRHKQELEESLATHKISDIFDELIRLKDGEEKSAYINEKDAIFIDDSFSERKKIHDACGIPVFDAHMLESLMEKV